MEQLRDIEIPLGNYSVTLYQLSLIGLTFLGLLVFTYLLLRKLMPWYYGRKAITARNRSRMRRTVYFVTITLFIVAVLQILEIDFVFYDSRLYEDGAGSERSFPIQIKISTFLKALMAFVVANILDLIIEEFLTQRYDTEAGGGAVAGAEQGATQRRFRAVRPLMYVLALIFLANDTGLSRYHLFEFTKMDEATDREVIDKFINVSHVLNALLLAFIIRLLVMVLTTFVLRGYYKRSKLDTGSQFAINRLLTYFIYLIGVLLVIQSMGFDLVVIWTGAAALLVGIGIGLQQTFNDLICGVIILFERSVKVGDVVELSGHQVGTVRKIGARTSVVETRDDIIIFVPNSKLIGENVTNWSHVRRNARFHVMVGVAYGSNTELVKKILLQVAEDHPRTMKSPKPIVRFLDFGSSSLDFDLIFWSRDFIRIEDVKSDLRFAIDQAFRTNNIEIPFPQRDLWIRGNAADFSPKKGEGDNDGD